MEAQSPRMPPLHPESFDEEQKALVGPWSILNFSRVMARHPALYRVYVPFIEKVISFTDLPPWDREVLVIRTLHQCGELYEALHHADIARKVGMSEAQLEDIKSGGGKLSEFDRVLITAADELVNDHCLSDASWAALSARYNDVELMELVGLVGCYITISLLTRSLQIEPEGDANDSERLDELRDYT